MIELNHGHDLGHGVMSDAGLIYCLGVSPGSVIRHNLFHDLLMPGKDFRELHWLGFSSTAAAETSFFIDNLKLVSR